MERLMNRKTVKRILTGLAFLSLCLPYESETILVRNDFLLINSFESIDSVQFFFLLSLFLLWLGGRIPEGKISMVLNNRWFELTMVIIAWLMLYANDYPVSTESYDAYGHVYEIEHAWLAGFYVIRVLLAGIAVNLLFNKK